MSTDKNLEEITSFISRLRFELDTYHSIGRAKSMLFNKIIKSKEPADPYDTQDIDTFRVILLAQSKSRERIIDMVDYFIYPDKHPDDKELILRKTNPTYSDVF